MPRPADMGSDEKPLPLTGRVIGQDTEKEKRPRAGGAPAAFGFPLPVQENETKR
jgi:hypothetical protein